MPRGPGLTLTAPHRPPLQGLGPSSLPHRRASATFPGECGPPALGWGPGQRRPARPDRSPPHTAGSHLTHTLGGMPVSPPGASLRVGVCPQSPPTLRPGDPEPALTPVWREPGSGTPPAPGRPSENPAQAPGTAVPCLFLPSEQLGSPPRGGRAPLGLHRFCSQDLTVPAPRRAPWTSEPAPL